MRLWFWGWLIAAAGIALASAVARDRASAPFAVGAACAAGLEAVGGTPQGEWIAFAVVSTVVFVAVNGRRYRRRHGWTGAGRRSPGHTAD